MIGNFFAKPLKVSLLKNFLPVLLVVEEVNIPIYKIKAIICVKYKKQNNSDLSNSIKYGG